jgi:hypothetical protein
MAKKATKGSKNNIENRGASAQLKQLDGKVVKPVMYKGSRLGHGNYIAARFEDGKLAYDASGKPVAYQLI